VLQVAKPDSQTATPPASLVTPATAVQKSQEHEIWRCTACLVEVSADALPMDAEDDASKNILKILEIAEEDRSRALDIESLVEFLESVTESLGEHHWIPAYLNYTLHWCYFEQRDKYSAFTHGLEYLDWFQGTGLNAPGYLLRRVFLLGTHCFQHVRQQAKKAASPNRWQVLMTHLTRAALLATDGECWASNRKMLALSAEMKEEASREPDRGVAVESREVAGMETNKVSLMARFKEALQAQTSKANPDQPRPRDCEGEAVKRARNG